ncbi:hypothetical protein CDAR_609101, partial [Caerostris darwini]
MRSVRSSEGAWCRCGWAGMGARCLRPGFWVCWVGLLSWLCSSVSRAFRRVVILTNTYPTGVEPVPASREEGCVFDCSVYRTFGGKVTVASHSLL